MSDKYLNSVDIFEILKPHIKELSLPSVVGFSLVVRIDEMPVLTIETHPTEPDK